MKNLSENANNILQKEGKPYYKNRKIMIIRNKPLIGWGKKLFIEIENNEITKVFYTYDNHELYELEEENYEDVIDYYVYGEKGTIIINSENSPYVVGGDYAIMEL